MKLIFTNKFYPNKLNFTLNAGIKKNFFIINSTNPDAQIPRDGMITHG